MFNFFEKPNKISIKNDITTQLINPLDKRIFTKQGEQLLIDLVKNGDYSTEAVNTEYGDWQPIIEKGVRLKLTDNNTGSFFIIPSDIAHWREGMAFEFIPTNMSQNTSFKVNKIYFNKFKLTNFLSMDSNTIIPLSEMKEIASYHLQFEGNGVEFLVLINNKQVSSGSDAFFGSQLNFSVDIPINKYLSVGNNTLIITPKNISNNSRLHVTITNLNRQNDIIQDGDILLNTVTATTDFSVPVDVNFE